MLPVPVAANCRFNKSSTTTASEPPAWVNLPVAVVAKETASEALAPFILGVTVAVAVLVLAVTFTDTASNTQSLCISI